MRPRSSIVGWLRDTCSRKDNWCDVFSFIHLEDQLPPHMARGKMVGQLIPGRFG